MLRSPPAIALLGVVACTTGRAPAAVAPNAAAASTTPATLLPAPAPAVPRDLAANATFADLLRTARVVLRAGDEPGAPRCVLRAGAGGFRLEASLMSGLDQLPDAPLELDPQLQAQHGPLRVLTAWGQIGSGEPALLLAAFTALPAASAHALGIALIQTDEGVYLRYSDGASSAADGPLTPEAAAARLADAPHNAGAIVYATAEADVPLARLVELLKLLPAGRSVALGVALPAGTRPPPPPGVLPLETCPDGLPEPEDGRAEGELDRRALGAALEPLSGDARACLEQGTGPARAGGHMGLALRIGPDGHVERACMQEGPGLDPSLAACVLSSARALRFPAPAPAGFVDVHVPLALTPLAEAPLSAICE